MGLSQFLWDMSVGFEFFLCYNFQAKQGDVAEWLGRGLQNNGVVVEWLDTGLQNLLQRFESAPRLQCGS